jgi:CheY-like chemotaxis protein
MLIVALSGYGREEDKERSRDSGFDVHLVKPVDPGAVERILAADRLNQFRKDHRAADPG